jgi:hypothetical protein
MAILIGSKMRSKFVEHPVKPFAINLRAQVLIRTNPRKLRLVINNGGYKFTKLSPLEVKKHHEELQKKQNEGTAPVKTCKPHKDCGTKRPHRKRNKQGLEGDDNDDNEEQEEEERPHKCLKSTEIMPAKIDGWTLELYVF